MKNKGLVRRTSLLHSLKSISFDCQQLFLSPIPNIDKVIPTDRSSTKKQIPSFQTKTRCKSALDNSYSTKTKIPQIRAFSVVNRATKSSLSDYSNEDICRKIYRKKIEQSKFKQNQKQQSLFVQKLANSIKGKEVNVTSYEIGPKCLKQLNKFLVLHDIQQLILDKNPIGDEGLRQLLTIVQHFNLKKLSLGSICMQQKGCDFLLQSLSKCTSIEQLNVCSYEGSYRNRLHNHGLKNIGKILQIGLKRLNLSNTGIDDINFEYLCDAMKKGCKLQVLNFAQNEITEVGMEAFKLSAVRVELNELDISRNKILGGGFLEMASLIGSDYNLTKISKSLKILKVCHVINKKDAFSHFCKELERNQVLGQLHIDYLRSENHNFLNQLSAFLRRNWSLKKLSMKKCLGLGNDCGLMWNSLIDNRGIETLIVPESHFSSTNFKQMCQCLTQNRIIKVLDLRSCKISDNDLIKSSELFTKIQVKKLFLDHNLINNAGANIIEQMIYKNKRIEELTLRSNSLTQKKLQELRKALKYNIDANSNVEFELNHYQNLQENTLTQKGNLLKTINELKEKEKALRYRHLLHQVVKKEVLNGQMQKEMKIEKDQIHKISELRQNVNQAIHLRKMLIHSKLQTQELNKLENLRLREKSSNLGISQVSEITSVQLV